MFVLELVIDIVASLVSLPSRQPWRSIVAWLCVIGAVTLLALAVLGITIAVMMAS